MSILASIMYGLLLIPVERCRRAADEALRVFPFRSAVVEGGVEFKDVMARLYLLIQQHLTGATKPSSASLEQAWEYCVTAFSEIYGNSGFHSALEACRTGLDSGVIGVARRLAYHLADTMGRQHVKGARAAWDALPLAEKFTLTDEFLKKYGHMLPAGLTSGSAGRVRAFLPDILEKVPELAQKFQQMRGW